MHDRYAMVAAFDRILLRLGLRIEDLPDGGVYVHVVEPVMLPILPVATAGPPDDGDGALIPVLAASSRTFRSFQLSRTIAATSAI